MLYCADSPPPMNEQKLEPTLPQSVLAAVGRVVVNFNYLEQWVSFYIAFLLGGTGNDSQQLGRIMANALSFRNLLDVLGSLYRFRTNGGEEFEDLLRRLGSAEEERNRVVHSIWGAGVEPGTVLRVKGAKKRHGRKLNITEMTIAEVAKIADDIAELSSNVVQRCLRFHTLGVRFDDPKDSGSE